MPAVTLATLRARAREYADMRQPGFVQDDAFGLDGHINDALQELLSIAAEAFGGGLAIQTPINSVADQEQYDLPADLFKVVTLEYHDRPLEKYSLDQVGMIRSEPCACPRYMTEAGNTKLRIFPAIQEVVPLRLWYIPSYPILSEGGTTSVTLPPHGDSYVAARAAMSLLAKEESDFSYPMGQMQAFEQRIRDAAWQQRPPQRVRDVRRHQCVVGL